MNHSLPPSATLGLLAPLAVLLLVMFGYPLGLVAWSSIYVDGAFKQLEMYEDWKGNVALAPGLFDPGHL